MKVYNRRAITVDEIVDDLLVYVERLRPMVADTALLLNQALDRGETVLFEGGQATMLDVDHGTYPFVTSSSATAGGAVTGAGVGPNRLDRIVGIVKAYTTRVGSGPFPTELFDEQGEWLRRAGLRVRHHDGPPAPRRAGTTPPSRATRRASTASPTSCSRSSTSSPGSTRSRSCVAYDVDGERFDEIPVSQTDFHHAKPIYEEFPGWKEDISGARDFDDLPLDAKNYVLALEEMSGSRISVIGVGPRPRP